MHHPTRGLLSRVQTAFGLALSAALMLTACGKDASEPASATPTTGGSATGSASRDAVDQAAARASEATRRAAEDAAQSASDPEAARAAREAGAEGEAMIEHARVTIRGYLDQLDEIVDAVRSVDSRATAAARGPQVAAGVATLDRLWQEFNTLPEPARMHAIGTVQARLADVRRQLAAQSSRLRASGYAPLADAIDRIPIPQ